MRSLVRLTVVLLGGVWHLSFPNRVRPMPPALEERKPFFFHLLPSDSTGSSLLCLGYSQQHEQGLPPVTCFSCCGAWAQ